MADNAKSTEQIEAAGEGLYAWVRETGGVLAIAAMMGDDEESGGIASRPEALIAGALGSCSEANIAVLIAQLDVAVLLMLSQMAEGAEMGEEKFRELVKTARKHMLDEEGLALCDECDE